MTRITYCVPSTLTASQIDLFNWPAPDMPAEAVWKTISQSIIASLSWSGWFKFPLKYLALFGTISGSVKSEVFEVVNF